MKKLGIPTIATLAVVAFYCLTAEAGEKSGSKDAYTKPQLYGMRPSPNEEWNLGCIGATGIGARIYKGLRVTVENTRPGSPADGKFVPGDVILGVDGERLEGRNPLVVLGQALTRAEAADGMLVFTVQPRGSGDAKEVAVKIPALGSYSETFPLQCAKSEGIIKRAADFYAGEERLKEFDLWNALACLYLLSTGDDQYLPRVKAYFAQFLDEGGGVKGVADHSWFNGYNGVACAEYYLRTGDASVMPLLQHFCDDARDRQCYGVGWGHWVTNSNPAYESGGGMQHAAGSQMLLTLVLAKMCGAQVDDKTLVGALRHWYRFAGHGAIPIADQRYWHIFRSAGRDGATAAVMHVASQAEGDVTIYNKARDYLAMSALTSWPSRNYDWEVYWHSLASHFTLKTQPGMYYTVMQRFQWQYDLGRNSQGGFEWAHNSGTKDATQAGICLALAYTAPLQTLCITGAPRSKYAKAFALPEWLWGTQADLAFLDPEHHKDFAKYGEDEEIHVPYWQLPTRLRYEPQDVKDLPLEMLQKNVRHARCEVRMAAAKSLCMNGHYGEIEALLRSPDPRLRRAGLDGINDCRPWFTGLPVGKNALPAEKYSPAMCRAITAMMDDPGESWFVIDGVLQALSHAPVDLIEKNLERIMPWTTHSDWWLRESAFFALMGLQRDEPLFVNYLPTLLKIMTDEYPYNPRHKMTQALREVLAQSPAGSQIHNLVAAGFARAATAHPMQQTPERPVRVREQAIHRVEAALASINLAPETAADIAEALASGNQLSFLDEDSIMHLIETHDDQAKNGLTGLLPARELLPEKDAKRVADALFDAFRPELIRRLETGKVNNVAPLINMIVTLTKLKRNIEGWKPIGTPLPEKRIWRYRTFDAPENEQLHPRIGAPERLRETTLPEGMPGWVLPGYDDEKWQSGHAPIGKGVYIATGHGRQHNTQPDFIYENQSAWGDGEFIAMRTTFTLTKEELAENDSFSLLVLSPEAYHVYLNGEKIHTYIWFDSRPHYKQILLGPEQTKPFREGENTLTALGILRYQKDKETDQYHTLGQGLFRFNS